MAHCWRRFYKRSSICVAAEDSLCNANNRAGLGVGQVGKFAVLHVRSVVFTMKREPPSLQLAL